MHLKNTLILAGVCFALACGASSAQDTPKIDEVTARANLIKQVDPVYPAIAKASHVTGDVVLQVKLSAKGTVESATAISGSSLLRPAALSAVKQWVFKPTKIDGLSSAVDTQITITFPFGAAVLAKKAEIPKREVAAVPPTPLATAESPAPQPVPDISDLTIAKEYFALEDRCHTLVAARADTADQASVCRDAALKADQFDRHARFIERRSAYVFAATALLRNKDFDEAVKYGDKAVGVVQQGNDDDSGSSASYAIRGQAEAFDDKLAAANDDLAQAEKFQRAAMETQEGHAHHDSYAKSLKGLLTFRAQVLDALGRTDEAKKLSDEANAL
jgi:TonB family protein